MKSKADHSQLEEKVRGRNLLIESSLTKVFKFVRKLGLLISGIFQCYGIQDSLGFWIPFYGLWFPGAGFQSFPVESGFWIPFLSEMSEYFSSILDSKALDSGFHKQNFPELWILQPVFLLRRAKSDFFKTTFENNKNNPNGIWKTIKSLIGVNKQQSINHLRIKEKDLGNNEEMTEAFNVNFSTIADKLRKLLPHVPFDTSKLSNFVRSRKDESAAFSIPPIAEADVVGYLLKIDSNKSTGVDGISSRMLKLAASIIAPSITKLINLSFSLNVFPSRWKTAKVTPIFKSGDPTDVTNYRSISVLPILSKIAERHVHNALYSFLCENDLIYIRQSGFRSKHSTETALIKIIDDLIFNLDNDSVSGMVLVDYLKAFDMVDHTLLLKKLEVYGLNRDSLQWLTSYLEEIKDAIWLSWETNSQVSLLFVMVFPRDPYLAPSYLSPLSMTYRFTSFHQELICMPTIQR